MKKKSFTVKDMPENLHWNLKMQAMIEHKRLNQLIVEILTQYLIEKKEASHG